MNKLCSVILLSIFLFTSNVNADSKYYDAKGNEITKKEFVEIKQKRDEKIVPIMKAREEAYRKSITRVVKPRPEPGISYTKKVYKIRPKKKKTYWHVVSDPRYAKKMPKNTWLTDHGYSISIYKGKIVNGVQTHEMVIDLPCMYINTTKSPCKRGTFSKHRRHFDGGKTYPIRRYTNENPWAWPWDKK